MHVAGFFGAGLAREYGGERGLALAEAVEGGDDVVEGFEAVHAFGAAAEFAGSLRTAEKQHAEDGDLAAVEVENFLQAMFVFSDAAIGAAGGARETFFLQGGECIADGISVERHYGVAIIFLIAGIHEGVEGQRIVIGRGDVFFDERAENANFDIGEGVHEVDCTAEEWWDEQGILRGGRGDVIGLA